MAENRNVGGLWCTEVLAHLSEYVDGELDAALVARVEAHLAGCDACTRFGGEFGALVAALRRRVVGELPASAVARLDALE